MKPHLVLTSIFLLLLNICLSQDGGVYNSLRYKEDFNRRRANDNYHNEQLYRTNQAYEAKKAYEMDARTYLNERLQRISNKIMALNLGSADAKRVYQIHSRKMQEIQNQINIYNPWVSNFLDNGGKAMLNKSEAEILNYATQLKTNTEACIAEKKNWFNSKDTSNYLSFKYYAVYASNQVNFCEKGKVSVKDNKVVVYYTDTYEQIKVNYSDEIENLRCKVSVTLEDGSTAIWSIYFWPQD